MFSRKRSILHRQIEREVCVTRTCRVVSANNETINFLTITVFLHIVCEKCAHCVIIKGKV